MVSTIGIQSHFLEQMAGVIAGIPTFDLVHREYAVERGN